MYTGTVRARVLCNRLHVLYKVHIIRVVPPIHVTATPMCRVLAMSGHLQLMDYGSSGDVNTMGFGHTKKSSTLRVRC